MALYSTRYDRVFRKFVPSIAKLSYSPLVKAGADIIARMLALPFPELRDLPPNHLRLRIGSGNRIFNGHVAFIETSYRCWLAFISRNYCTSSSDVVELGCGCGHIARALREPWCRPWFEGAYLGVDIDSEMIEYCRRRLMYDGGLCLCFR
jgi:SAM-dependent methyltransferase